MSGRPAAIFGERSCSLSGDPKLHAYQNTTQFIGELPAGDKPMTTIKAAIKDLLNNRELTAQEASTDIFSELSPTQMEAGMTAPRSLSPSASFERLSSSPP
jgi:hypothetical protein